MLVGHCHRPPLGRVDLKLRVAGLTLRRSCASMFHTPLCFCLVLSTQNRLCVCISCSGYFFEFQSPLSNEGQHKRNREPQNLRPSPSPQALKPTLCLSKIIEPAAFVPA